MLAVVGALGITGCVRADDHATGIGIEDRGVSDGGCIAVDESDASVPATNECPATRIVAESDISAIRTLTSDATQLYYVLWPCDLDDCPPQPHEVRAVPKGGGTPTLLAFEPGSISEDIAVAGGHVYWIRSRERALMRVLSDGSGQPEVVYQSDAMAFLSANAHGVYWRSLDGNERWTRLERLPLSGGVVETAAILPSRATFSLLDDGRSYYLIGNSPAAAQLFATDLLTGLEHALTEQPESFGGGEFTQDAVALQWSGSRGLRRLAKTGGDPVTISDESNYDVGSNGELALYYRLESADLRAVPVTGGSTTVVAPPTCDLFGVWLERVVAADRVYWSSGHEIHSVPLPQPDGPPRQTRVMRPFVEYGP
jgi:hypothetical protein